LILSTTEKIERKFVIFKITFRIGTGFFYKAEELVSQQAGLDATMPKIPSEA
jgi:hypothetical protein